MQKFDAHGMAVPSLAIAIIVSLAVVSFGGIIYSEIQETAASQADDDCSTVDTIGENIVGLTEEAGEDLFPLIILVVLLGAFGAIIFVLKTWG